MAKLCLHCNKYPVFSKGYCKSHQYLRTDSKKPVNKISPFSDKMLKGLKLYKVLRFDFLEKHPLCAAKIDGHCTKYSSQVHHMGGRIGDKLVDVKNFLPVCHNCHCYIEVHPEEAKEKGWSKNRY